MRHSEYEERRRALEKQFAEDLDLIRAAHQSKLRALEMLWLASPAPETAAAAEPVPAVEESQTPPSDETQSPSETQIAGEPQVTSEPKAPAEAQSLGETQEEARMAPPGELRQAILDALPRLPDIFDRHDLEAALGYAPPRSSIVRVLKDMWGGKELAVEEFSEGRRPTRYRKVAESA